MSTPLLIVLAGPNGAGKTTFVERVLSPVTNLPFVNADIIAATRWPGDESAHAYDASRAAVVERDRLMSTRSSFITETVFSHPSKLALLEQARLRGYLVQLYVVLVPVDVSVNRVSERISRQGHSVPEHKIRERYARLWPLVAEAALHVDRALFYDNLGDSRPFRLLAAFDHGASVGTPVWPAWTPGVLLDL